MRAVGTRRIYALDEAGLDAAQAWLTQLSDPLGPFAQPLDALATEFARGRRARRIAPVHQRYRGTDGDAPASRDGSRVG